MMIYIDKTERQLEKGWYIDDLARLAEERSLDDMSMLHEIYKRFFANRNYEDKKVLDDDSYEAFLNTVSDCLQSVSVKGIMESENLFFDDDGNSIKIPAFLRRQLYRLKSPGIKESLIVEDDKNISFMIGSTLVGSISDEKIQMRSQQIVDGCLHMEGYFSGRQFLDMGGRLYVVINSEDEKGRCINKNEVELAETQIESQVSFFGRVYHKDFTFKVVLKLSQLESFTNVSFIYKYKDISCTCPMSFDRPQARLFTKTRCNHWVFDDKMLIYSPGKKEICISPLNNFSFFLRELMVFLFIPFTRYSLKRKLYLIYMRALYWLTKPKYSGQKIWIYFDKLYKGGDNGEYLFRYAAQQSDDISHYYIINDNTPESRELRDEGYQVLSFKSRKNKILVFHSDKIFGTHSNVLKSAGLMRLESFFFGGLIHAEISCIQHGLTIQYIPDIQSRIVDNTAEYFCASEYEVRNLLLPPYDYSPNHLHITGIPRYAGLKSSPENIVLISPTWRRSLAYRERGKGNPREYNPDFKKSEYYRIYQSLINNEALLKVAAKEKTRIIFLLHPTIAEQESDFISGLSTETKIEYEGIVSIIKSTSDVKYEDMLRKADLMITDYSGVQYDFAYMRKPVIYYHPDTLPPHYDSRVFDYDTDGFGPVLKNENDLVSTMVEYIENGYDMSEEYLNRINRFFKYSDHGSCKRIYDYFIEREKTKYDTIK